VVVQDNALLICWLEEGPSQSDKPSEAKLISTHLHLRDGKASRAKQRQHDPKPTNDGEDEPKNRHEVTASEAKLIGPQPQHAQGPRRPASFFLREEIGRFVA
jgi:hypothetical protein